MKRRVWQRALSLALIFAMAIILVNPIAVEAKTKKLKLPWGSISEPTTTYIDSKAVTITKTGNYKVEERKKTYYYSGFIKFVVPKTKKYTFTFSNLRAKGSSPCLAYAEFSTPSGQNNGILYISGKTKKYSGTNQFPFGYKVPGKQNVAKRAVTYNLTKGQVVYINIVNAYNKTKGKTLKFNLKIK